MVLRNTARKDDESRYATSKAGKDEQSASRISSKAKEKLEDLFQELGDLKVGLKRHIRGYKEAMEEAEGKKSFDLRWDMLKERSGAMEEATKLFDEMQAAVNEGSLKKGSELKDKFGSAIENALHPDRMKDELYLQAKREIAQAREDIQGKEIKRLARTSNVQERKSWRSTDESYIQAMLFNLGQILQFHDIGETNNKMFDRLDDMIRNKDVLRDYIEREAGAYTSAKMIGEALNAANRKDEDGKSDIYALSRFFRDADIESRIPKVTYESAKGRAKAARSKAKVAGEDYSSRANALDEYYDLIKAKLGKGEKEVELDRSIRYAIIDARGEGAGVEAFISARKLVNYSWIRYSGSIKPEDQPKLRDLNDAASTIEEQEALLNRELILYLHENAGIYYDRGGLSQGNQEFARSMFSKDLISSGGGQEFGMGQRWDSLWDDVWNVYRRHGGAKGAEGTETATAPPVNP